MTIKHIILLIFVFLVFSGNTQAAGLVPDCDGFYCQACDLLKLFQNLMNAAITFAVFLATIGIAWNGFKMVAQGKDNPMMHTFFRQKMKNIIIGFVLMLGAWVIVDAVMKSFLSDDFNKAIGGWNTIQCVAQPVPGTNKIILKGAAGEGGKAVSTPVVVEQVTAGGTTIKGIAPNGKPYLCTDCVHLKGLVSECKSDATCSVERGTAAKLVELNKTYPLRITEGMPPTAGHSNECHYNGTCVDATVASAQTPTQIAEFMQKAKATGIRPVWEGDNCTTRTQLRSLGYEAFCKTDNGYGHITGTHYSLYGQ